MDLSPFEHLRVSLESEGRVVVVELHHGKANEVGSAVLREIAFLVDALRDDASVVGLITYSRRRSSKGTPLFVAGADVTERTGWSVDRVKEHVRWQRSVLARLARVPAFHVVVVDGVALGWGTEFLLTADYALAGGGAVFGLPETGLGILPGAGGTSELWARIGANHALRLGMTGERIGADEAVRIGLAQERVDDVDAGLERARALMQQVVRKSPTALAAFKSTLLDALGQPGPVRREREAKAYERCVDRGDAAVGREQFAAIRRGEAVPWHPRRLGEE